MLKSALLVVASVIIFWPLALSAADSEATFSGNILTIPKVLVGAEAYYLELSLIQGSGAIDFSVVGALKLTEFDAEGGAIFDGDSLTIPILSISEKAYQLKLTLISTEPLIFRLTDYTELSASKSSGDNESRVEDSVETGESETEAPKVTEPSLAEQVQAMFTEEISQPIVMGRCVVCHVAGGASGNSSLVFQRGNAKEILSYNLSEISNYVARKQTGAQTILLRVSGVGHGGGTVLPPGSPLYLALSDFLALVKKSQE